MLRYSRFWTLHGLIWLRSRQNSPLVLAEFRAWLSQPIRKDYYTTMQIQAGPNQAPLLKRDINTLHIYKARVVNIIDGDTLFIHVDLGFGVWSDQRLRLRGINTEELTKNGKPMPSSDRATRAKAFVAEKLQGIPFVVIKTHKSDSYGRYVGDLFYHPTISNKEDVAAKGFFLNEELLQAGLADVGL